MLPNMTPNPIKQMQKAEEQRRETRRLNEQIQRRIKDDDATFRRLTQMTKRETASEWKPKPDPRYDVPHHVPLSTGVSQPFMPKIQHHQAQQRIDTSNDTGKPVTHHVKAVFVFLGYLALTIVFGVLVGNIFGGSFNTAVVAWAIGLYITIGVTKWVWRKHDE